MAILCWQLVCEKKISFGAVKLTKNANPEKHSHSEYGIPFDVCGIFLLSNDAFGKILVIFGVNMSSSVRIDKKILILDKGPK